MLKFFSIVVGLSFGGVSELVAMLSLHQQKLRYRIVLAMIARENDYLIDSVQDALDAGGLKRLRSYFQDQCFFLVNSFRIRVFS